MLVIHRRIDPQPVWAAELHLNFEARSKSRLRCFSVKGEDVGLFLERGQPPLYDGECLQAEDGRIVRSTDDAAIGEQLDARLHDGRLLLRVEGKQDTER